MQTARRGRKNKEEDEAGQKRLYLELRDLAERSGIQVIQAQDSALIQGGATGRVRNQELVVLDSRAGISRRINILLQSLRKIDWNKQYLKPELRKLLEGGDTHEP